MAKCFQNLWGKVLKIQLRLKILGLQCLQRSTEYQVLILVVHVEEIKIYFILRQGEAKKETHIRQHANIVLF